MLRLHETGIEVWFKGGTSLSKGFGLIERFSEDLDLMVERGPVVALPDVSNWTSLNEVPVAQGQAFCRSLADAFTIPTVPVEQAVSRAEKYESIFPVQTLSPSSTTGMARNH